MRPPDSRFDFEKELASGPFPRKMFTDRLKRQIEDTIDRREKTPRRWLPLLSACSFMLCLLAVALWFDRSPLPERNSTAPLGDRAEPTSGSFAMLSAEENGTAAGKMNSGLLIGLRTDGPDFAASSYRTLYIAPEKGEPVKVAEGNGVLVPYKQQFWRIEPEFAVNETTNEIAIQLTAYPAEQAQGETAAAERIYGDISNVGSKTGNTSGDSNSNDNYSDSNNSNNAGGKSSRDKVVALSAGFSVIRTEKLMFAGNEYVAVAEAKAQAAEEPASSGKRVWVSRVPDLQSDYGNGNMNDRSIGSLAHRRQVALKELLSMLPDSERKAAESEWGQGGGGPVIGESWTIARRPGRWIAQAAEAVQVNGRETVVLRDLPYPLPEAVVSHDSLCCSWNDLTERRNDAIDALSSPDGDMVAIFTNDAIAVYPIRVRGQIAEEPSLIVPLRPNEALIMAQWATGRYVDDWKQRVKRILAPAGQQ